MNDKSSAVFNGKIFVQPDAQKTNAYQSNKNILLSADASVNTKPQLEIFADDVKCSHGCTIGNWMKKGCSTCNRVALMKPLPNLYWYMHLPLTYWSM